MGEVVGDKVGDEAGKDVMVALLPVEARSEMLDVEVEMIMPFVRLNHILHPEASVANMHILEKT